tara:strand:+ start:1784 stop:2416 length:633 start_codon:yes stop_codon:yes gene_type:complete
MASKDNAESTTELQKEIESLKQEIHELRATNKRWMRIAGTDLLTKIPNRVYFTMSLLPTAINHANAESSSVGCIMIAPDNLGDINQNHGRSAGNEIVVGISDFLRENIEEDETLVHHDGANFILLIPSADLNACKRRSLHIRAKVSNNQFDCAGTQISITISMGAVSRLPSAQKNIKQIVEQFLVKLEAALDKAKAMGGDRMYEDPEVVF